MKKFANWFMKQTSATKFSLVGLGVVLLIVAIFQLASLTQGAPEPVESNNPTNPVNTPTPTPTPTGTPTPGPLNPNNDAEGGTEIELNLPYTAEQVNAITPFLTAATLAFCNQNSTESNEAMIARLAPYFETAEELVNGGYARTGNLQQVCTIFGSFPESYNATDNTVTYSVTSMRDSISFDQQDIPQKDWVITRETVNNFFELKLKEDGNWIIVRMA